MFIFDVEDLSMPEIAKMLEMGINGKSKVHGLIKLMRVEEFNREYKDKVYYEEFIKELMNDEQFKIEIGTGSFSEIYFHDGETLLNLLNFFSSYEAKMR